MNGLRALFFTTLICGTPGLVYGQSLTLNASPNPANLGQTVTMTATLTNLSLANFTSVTFYETINASDVTLGSSNVIGSGTVRTATLTKNNFTVGTHNLKAQSCPPSIGAPSTEPKTPSTGGCFTGFTTLTVLPPKQNSSITLNSSPNPSTFGSPVTLTGTVSPSSATGTVTFFDGGAPLGSGNLSNGVATLVVGQAVGNFSAGTHLLTATYNGDNSFNQSFSQGINQVVNPAGGPMTITSISPGSAAAGSAGFTLTINGTGFISNVTATWNNTSLATSFGSSTQVTATVPTGFLASAGTALIKVVSGNNASNGAPFVVNPPGQSCNFTFSNFSPANLSFGAGGGSGSVFVTATRNDCTWSATSNVGFITFGGSITGSGTLNFNVLANGGSSSRSGKITVGAQSFSITQGGTTCLFSLPSSSQAFGPGGGNGTAAVQATPGCGWSATGGSPFVTVNAPGGGSGNGLIGYSVAANPSGSTRSVTLTIANQPYTVIQAGSGSNVNCTATAAATPLVALEGLTEAAGGININCTGVTSTIKGDVVLTLNTNVTNPLNGTINALLSVNGGAPLSGVVTGYNIIRFPNVSLTPTGNNTVNLAISQVCANANVIGVLSSPSSDLRPGNHQRFDGGAGYRRAASHGDDRPLPGFYQAAGQPAGRRSADPGSAGIPGNPGSVVSSECDSGEFDALPHRADQYSGGRAGIRAGVPGGRAVAGAIVLGGRERGGRLRTGWKRPTGRHLSGTDRDGRERNGNLGGAGLRSPTRWRPGHSRCCC